MRYFVGLDWAKLKHAVCVIDEDGEIIMRLAVDHTAEGLARLVLALRRFGDPAELGIAIERPSGLLVDTLVEAGFVVYPIHPNVMKASQPRYSAALGKTDPGDAYLLADLLRTDGHRFRALCSVSDETRALRALVRARSDLVGARVGLANQLRVLLESFWAGAVAIFGEIDSPIALAFLLEFPTPESAARLGQKQMAAFLSDQGYCGRRSPDELLQRLRAAPVIKLGPAEMVAKGTLVCSYATLLDNTVKQIRQITSAIERAVITHSDATVFTSFPRIGKINAAQILAELDARDRFLSEEQLAGEAGVAPVTRISSKHRAVVFR
jgi:transposase